eukprot:c4530_g1_i1.p1 GENE.c4530_g1_i1~~c4530_g1_i1.p1  ORF type:complete len:636 (-),score=91.67 c4530_g1_i1:59-1966(-)
MTNRTVTMPLELESPFNLCVRGNSNESMPISSSWVTRSVAIPQQPTNSCFPSPCDNVFPELPRVKRTQVPFRRSWGVARLVGLSQQSTEIFAHFSQMKAPSNPTLVKLVHDAENLAISFLETETPSCLHPPEDQSVFSAFCSLLQFHEAPEEPSGELSNRDRLHVMLLSELAQVLRETFEGGLVRGLGDLARVYELACVLLLGFSTPEIVSPAVLEIRPLIMNAFFRNIVEDIHSNDSTKQTILYVSKLGLANLASCSSQQKVPRAVVEQSLRPVLMQFCLQKSLVPSLVYSLHSVIMLFPHLFNTSFANKLAQTLREITSLYSACPDVPTLRMVCKMFDMFHVFAANQVFDCAPHVPTLVETAASMLSLWFSSGPCSKEVAQAIPEVLARFLFYYPQQGLLALYNHPALLNVVLSFPHSYPMVVYYRTNPVFADHSRTNSLERYCGSADLSDVVLVVGREAVQIPAHTIALAQSKYFKALLLNGMSETHEKVVRLPMFEPEHFVVALKVIYGVHATVALERIASIEALVSVFELADMIGLEELARECETRLCRMCNEHTIWALLQLASRCSGSTFGFGSCLLATCETFILSHLTDANSFLFDLMYNNFGCTPESAAIAVSLIVGAGNNNTSLGK